MRNSEREKKEGFVMRLISSFPTHGTMKRKAIEG
jgi:hypothetical protein